MLRASLFCRPHQVPGQSLRGCIEVARRADLAGFYSIHFGEHLVVGDRTDRYPYGAFPHPRETPWLEPLSTLAAMAAVTDHIRLSTGVVLAPLRPAVVLAKEIATLDVLSCGRVELGVGTGWQREEYESVGVPWKGRRERLWDAIGACRALWEQQPASFLSQTVSFTDVHAYPPPVQSRVPVLFGIAIDDGSAAHIARLGDGWCPVGLQPEDVAAGVTKLRKAFSDLGRDPFELRIRARLPDSVCEGSSFDFQATLAAIPPLAEAGVTIFSVSSPPDLPSMDELERWMKTFADLCRTYPGSIG